MQRAKKANKDCPVTTRYKMHTWHYKNENMPKKIKTNNSNEDSVQESEASPGKDESLRVKQANFVMSNRVSDGVMDDETGELVEYWHTHTHPFNGPFSRTTRVSRYQKGETNLDFTEARDSEWHWHQLGRMQVCISLQTDNHASTPPLKFFYRPDALPAAQPTASKHWRHWQNTDREKQMCIADFAPDIPGTKHSCSPSSSVGQDPNNTTNTTQQGRQPVHDAAAASLRRYRHASMRHIMGTHNVVNKTVNTKYIATLPEEDRTTQ